MLVEDLQTCNVELISWARLSASFRHSREHRCGMEVLAAFLEKHMMGNFSDLPMSNLTVNTCKNLEMTLALIDLNVTSIQSGFNKHLSIHNIT